MQPEYPIVDPGLYSVSGQCARNKNHVQIFFFVIVRHTALDYSIKKIGQHPSFGDLTLPRLRKYAAVLNAKLLGELNRAVGLAAHDVGVGAYVYLRRVFEALIDEAHTVARQDPGWGEELYVRSRMPEKMVFLKAHLPTFLVEHPEMYSLLSKGIHELSEKECLAHFDTLRSAIELILAQTIEKKEMELRTRDAESALSKAFNATKA